MEQVPPLMKAVVLTAHGGPEVLEYREDVPVPTVSKEKNRLGKLF